MAEQVNFFRSRHWKVFLVTLAIALPIFVVSTFEDLFLILIVSFVLTMILKPIVDYLERFGLARWIAVLTIFLVLGSVATVAVMILFPIISAQISQIANAFSKERLTVMLNDLSSQISSQLPHL